MAEIVNSLFGLPSQDVRNQMLQRQSDFSNQFASTYNDPTDRRNALLGGAVGNALANFGAGLFGVQDPQLKRATDLERILGETQQEVGADPTLLYPALQQKLANAGYSREALQVAQAGQSVLQQQQLNQAKILTEQAQLAKAQQEKLPEIVRLTNMKRLAEQQGDTALATNIQAAIDKTTNIPEKTLTPQNEAEVSVLEKYKKLYPDNPGLAGEAFLEYKSTLRQKEAKAGVAQGQTEPIDITRLDTSFEKFVTPNKEKLSSINEALKLAEQAQTNPQAGVQLNALLSSLYQGGRLSNQDINRTTNPGSLPAQVLNNFNKIISGTDTETNIADKVKLLKALQSGVSNSLNESVDSWAERWQTAPGVSKDTIDTYTKGAKFRKKEATKPKTAAEYLKGL